MSRSYKAKTLRSRFAVNVVMRSQALFNQRHALTENHKLRDKCDKVPEDPKMFAARI